MLGDVHGGQNQQPGGEGDADVQQGDGGAHARQAVVFAQVGAVDQHGAHAQREREERLAHGAEQQAGVRQLAEVGDQVGFQAIGGAGLHQNVENQPEQNDKQQRHQSGGPGFDAIFHAFGDDGHGKSGEDAAHQQVAD